MSAPETILYRAHPSWLYFMGLILLTGTVLLFLPYVGDVKVCVELAMFFLLLLAFARYRRLYMITDHRVIMRTGLVANNTNEMEIRHIRGINLRQGVVERLLGIGTLEIISAADGGAEVVFSGIRDPMAVKERIRTLRPTI